MPGDVITRCTKPCTTPLALHPQQCEPEDGLSPWRSPSRGRTQKWVRTSSRCWLPRGEASTKAGVWGLRGWEVSLEWWLSDSQHGRVTWSLCPRFQAPPWAADPTDSGRATLTLSPWAHYPLLLRSQTPSGDRIWSPRLHCFPLDGEDLILDTSHAPKSYLK